MLTFFVNNTLGRLAEDTLTVEAGNRKSQVDITNDHSATLNKFCVCVCETECGVPSIRQMPNE